MGAYQSFRGDPENKLFYIINNLVGGINTEYSDDTSNDNEFKNLVNFDLETQGSLKKRKGWGKLNALSQIFELFTDVPSIRTKSIEYPNPEALNDNLVYAKLLENDNNVFRNLSAFDTFQDYQEKYGFQSNSFKLLMITTSELEDTSTAWILEATLPELEYDIEENMVDTIEVTSQEITLDLKFEWDYNLKNIDVLEYGDKIHFTKNDKGMVTFDKSSDTFTYSGFYVTDDARPIEVGDVIIERTLNLTIPDLLGDNDALAWGDTVIVGTGTLKRLMSLQITKDAKHYNCFCTDVVDPTVVSDERLIYSYCREDNALIKNLSTYVIDDENWGTVATVSEGGGVPNYVNLFQYIEIVPRTSNDAYRPNAMEVRKIGFNMLGDSPLHWISFQGITTDTIQGMYITTTDSKPLQVIPNGGKFKLNVLYTGTDDGFTFEFKEGDNDLEFTVAEDTALSNRGLKVYNIAFANTPTTEIEIKITKTGATINPYYDYYEVGPVRDDLKAATNLNVGALNVIEHYSRAVYYGGNTLWFSDIGIFNYVPNYNYQILPIESDDEIIKIIFFRNVYIIYTKLRIYKMINAYGSDDFQIMPVNESIGCHAPNTIIPIENELYFASPRGLYALKSSEYRDGIENLKILDDGVKSLTSDKTLFIPNLDTPNIRYSGISKRACAIRYKDKYVVYYNNVTDLGDVIGGVSEDALVYNVILKSFTEYTFSEKPTFMFMVDNHLETLCKIADKEEYTEEELLIEYDFETETPTLDLSGNNYDLTLSGTARTNSSYGLEVVPANECEIDLGELVYDDLSKGFKIKLHIDCKEVKECSLVCFDRELANNARVSFSMLEDDSISFEVLNGLGVATTEATSGVDIGMLGEHIWIFEVKLNLDGGYTYSITRDGVAVYTTTLAAGFITAPSLLRNWNTIGFHPSIDGFDYDNSFYGDVYLFEMYVNEELIMKYNFGEGTGSLINDISGNLRNGTVSNITRISDTGLILDGDGYGVIPEISEDIRWTNGFKFEFEMKSLDLNRLCTIFDFATSVNSGTNNDLKCGILMGTFNVKDVLSFKTTSYDKRTYNLSTDTVDLSEKSAWVLDCVDSGTNYVISLYKDTVLIKSGTFSYGGITNILRKSNFIGKSNNINLSNFRGIIYNFKAYTYASLSAFPVYKNAIYEFETAFTDFGKSMPIYIGTKGTNFKYPQHIKKLKNVVIKGSGGYNYTNYVMGILADGHLLNNPYTYETSINEITGEVIYTYSENRLLEFSEKKSLLGTMRIGSTRLGETTYETKKLSIPGSGKNFEIQISGESSDDLIIDSFGFIFKLGKVKER